jgi:3-hydroxyisobutyrate dehydrogenase-like beta-hydroxyacid dehydrogenase|tara:strand:+ start:540 stop:641 length:102 start_codon:yes stop_codon:yes gene_type:complete
MNIGFIGIGKLGMPCAEAIAKKGTMSRAFNDKL